MLNIKIDSRDVKSGDIFVVINGERMNNEKFVQQAIDNGASKIVSTSKSYSIDTEIVTDSMGYINDYLVHNYADKINSMNLVGVTGTNGKTTTCYLIHQLLNKVGIKTAYLGTLGYYRDTLIKEMNNTTPNIVELYTYLMECYELGYHTVVMEVSSHALDYQRVHGLKFKTGAFTNLTQDHLDYHKTMDNYLAAKMKLLNQVNGSMIVNVDDEHGIKFLNNNGIGIGFGDYQVAVQNYAVEDSKTRINFIYNNKEYSVLTSLKAKFNVYNFLTALFVSLQIYNDLDGLLSFSDKIDIPKGRCQIIPVKKGEAVVDYAHTPDAVQKVITGFRESCKGKIITVVGCGGDRDATKRPIMGQIACDYSDYAIFTSDNPRTEDPKLILDDIIRGTQSDNFEVILDRREAILKSLQIMQDNDIILILGKGHEDYQVIGHVKHHLDDAEIVIEYVNSL